MIKILLLAFTLAATCLAQNTEPTFFKLDFVVKEVDAGKVLNSRSYSLIASTDRQFAPSIRTGSKIPSVAGPNGQYTYLEVGVNIDCRYLKQMEQSLALQVTADVSSLTQEVPSPSQTNDHPIIRQNKWSSEVVVPLRKPFLIFSSDDNTTKHQMQLQITATPMKEP